jgi:polysaccharide deacetylase 2 family uncharacterized protein YibQ
LFRAVFADIVGTVEPSPDGASKRTKTARSRSPKGTARGKPANRTKRRPRRKAQSLAVTLTFAGASVFVVAVALVAIFLNPFLKEGPSASVKPPLEAPAIVAPAVEPGAQVVRVQPRAVPARPPAPRPRPSTLVFIIDDAGYSMKELEAFLRLPFPLTIAVLPGLPGSTEAARAVLAAGKELILHQPMEALGGQDPGPQAIGIGADRSEAARIVAANLADLPGALGMNNHMGSAVTTDPDIMGAVAAIAKARGIYYVDSLTVSGTASAAAAHREGIRYWERDVFLDNSPDRASIIRAIEEGKKRASRNRPAIMIGHVWSAELAQALSDLYPQLIADGYSLSTISRYMLEEAAADDADTRD